MRKYNRLSLSSILICFLMILFSSNFLFQMKEEKEGSYRTEVNRIIHALKNRDNIETLQKQGYKYIKKISVLEADASKEEKISFFEGKNEENIIVYPWYQTEHFLGYIKFAYIIPEDHFRNIWFLVSGCLLLFEAFVIFLLWYIQVHIILPFDQVSTLPLELANGRFKGEIKIQKSKYFKNFLWGMSSLKDTLDISHQKNLAFMKEKQELLLSLSHDVKTPLNIIKLYVKSLEEDLYENEEKKKEALCKIGEKATEIELYVEEIKKSGREELFDLTVKMEEFYLKDLLCKVLPIYEEQCQIRGITLYVESYENYLLKADMNRSQEVLENILENAMKYGDGREIKISFREEEYRHCILIENTGTPVSENECTHLFDSFFRGKNAKNKPGSGLGLYICRKLMQKMGGSIYTEIREGKMIFVIIFR